MGRHEAGVMGGTTAAILQSTQPLQSRTQQDGSAADKAIRLLMQTETRG